MKTETILKMVNEIMESHGDIVKIYDLKMALEEDIRKQVCKVKELKKDSAIKKLFKKSRPPFNNKSFPYNGKRAFTDSYRLYIVNDDYGYEKSDKPTIQNLMNEFTRNINNYKYSFKIDMQDLIVFNKIAKTEKNIDKKPYILEQDDLCIGFNSTYLLELLQTYKTDTIYCLNSRSAAFTSLDLDQEFGILMPVNVK